jgi:hypothetical protein
MITFEEIKRILPQYKQEIREKYGVKILGIFGSYTRRKQDKASDIDILLRLKNPLGSNFLSYGIYLKKFWE